MQTPRSWNMKGEKIQGREKGRKRKRRPPNKQNSDLPEPLGEPTQGPSISRQRARPCFLGHVKKKAVSTVFTHP